MPKIKAVAFDWGGVLIDDPAPGLTKYAAEALGVEKAVLFKEFSRYVNDFQCGRIEEHALWADLCPRLGVPVPGQASLYGEAVENVFTARAEVFGLVESLKKAGYRTGFLSNTEVPAVKYFRSQNYTCFDATVFSCEEHMAKPEPGVYQVLLDRLGTAADETVFIDDRTDYINGARECGIRTVQFGGFEQVASELKNAGVAW